jgi:hypothetical protein
VVKSGIGLPFHGATVSRSVAVFTFNDSAGYSDNVMMSFMVNAFWVSFQRPW